MRPGDQGGQGPPGSGEGRSPGLPDETRAGASIHFPVTPEDWRRFSSRLARLARRQEKTHDEVRRLRDDVGDVERKVDALARPPLAAVAPAQADTAARFGVAGAITGTGLSTALMSTMVTVAVVEGDDVDWDIVAPGGFLLLAAMVVIAFSRWVGRP